MNWTFWTRTPPTIPDDCETIDPLLSQYADGMASPDEARRVEAHLPGCAACRASLAWMRATRFALAARPVALPPADLRARIAEAIAASSDAPVPATFRTRRAFALRPALAAAASFVMLGVVGYGLLHHPPFAAVQPVTPPQVAGVPPAHQSPPVVKAITARGVKLHAAHHSSAAPRPARLDPDQIARSQPDAVVPAPPVVKKRPQAKTDTRMLADAVPAPKPARSQPSVAKKPTSRVAHPEMTAATNVPARSAAPRNLPVHKPEPKADDALVADAPRAAAPSIIEKPPIITHDPVPVVAVASSQEGRIQTAEERGLIRFHFAMRTFKQGTVDRADRGAMIATTMADQSRLPGFDITRGALSGP